MDMFRRLAALDEHGTAYQRQKDAIIERCLPLADHIARRFSNRGEPLDDLVQVARIGLLNAVNRFDVEAGSEFLAFAVPTMLGEVRRHFRDHGWAVKVPRRLKDLNALLKQARAELSQQLNRAPTASELASHLDVDREEVVQAMIAASGYSTRSSDASVASDDDSGRSVIHTLGVIDDNLDKVVDINSVRPALAALSERDRTILRLRFFDNQTQSQIAQHMGMSQMHVSRLLTRSLATVRAHVESPAAV